MTARDLIARLGKEKTLDGRIQDIESTVRSVRVAGIKAQRLSDIAPDIGIVEAGEIRLGNGAQPGAGFSGVRLSSQAMSYGGEDYQIAMVSNDAIVAGTKTSDRRHYIKMGNEMTANGAPVTQGGTFTGSVGVTETDIATYSLPAASIFATNTSIEVIGGGTTAANGNNKVAKLYFGGTVIATTRNVAANNDDFWLHAIIQANGAAQTAIGHGMFNGFSPGATYAEPAEASGGIITIKITGTGTANNDLRGKFLYIKIFS